MFPYTITTDNTAIFELSISKILAGKYLNFLFKIREGKNKLTKTVSSIAGI